MCEAIGVCLPVSGLYFPLIVFRKQYVRGVLTNGHHWIFLMLHLNPDGTGGTFNRSVELGLPALSELDDLEPIAVKSRAELIAGILFYWVSPSF